MQEAKHLAVPSARPGSESGPPSHSGEQHCGNSLMKTEERCHEVRVAANEPRTLRHLKALSLLSSSSSSSLAASARQTYYVLLVRVCT